MIVYHFVPLQFALSNIALRRLKIARIGELNDPFEMLSAIVDEDRVHDVLRQTKDLQDQTTGVLCFSSTYTNPLLWGHYADRHRGCALGVEVSDLEIDEMRYVKEPVRIRRDAMSGAPLLNDKLVARLLNSKFIDWKYEREHRIWVKLDYATRESGMYFYPFDDKISLKEVILGPKCELPPDSMRHLVAAVSENVKVFSSSLGRGKFTVQREIVNSPSTVVS